jgi:hypothetical protein
MILPRESNDESIRSQSDVYLDLFDAVRMYLQYGPLPDASRNFGNDL